MLPGSLRTIEVDWKGSEPPTALNIDFDRFTLKPPFAVAADPPFQVSPTGSVAQAVDLQQLPNGK